MGSDNSGRGWLSWHVHVCKMGTAQLNCSAKLICDPHVRAPKGLKRTCRSNILMHSLCVLTLYQNYVFSYLLPHLFSYDWTEMMLHDLSP